MESQFGWTLLSRDALRRAESQLREDTGGVRDKIGFLALHQAYADPPDGPSNTRHCKK